MIKKPNDIHTWIQFAMLAEDHDINWLCETYAKQYQTIVNWKIELINRTITDFWEPGEYKLEKEIKKFKQKTGYRPIELYARQKLCKCSLSIKTPANTKITIG